MTSVAQVSILTQPEWPVSCEQKRHVTQRVLLGMTAVCAILSVVPPLRLGASLARRAITLLSAAITKTSPEKFGRFLYALRISAVVFGILALAASMPVLMIASLAVDICLQIGLTVQAIRNKEYLKALVHLSVMMVDILAITGFVLASWKLMVASAAVSGGVMLGLAVYAGVSKKFDMLLSYLGMLGADLAIASIPSQQNRWPLRAGIVRNIDDKKIVKPNQQEALDPKDPTDCATHV